MTDDLHHSLDSRAVPDPSVVRVVHVLNAESEEFTRAEILWLNPDDEGDPQDFAIWAVKG